jgi:regulator of protease activity HflC (stomatin/prohibitin superfamily)
MFFTLAFLSIGLIVGLWLLCSCLFIVKPKEARMVQSWIGGTVLRVDAMPGLKFKFPFPFQSVSSAYELSNMMISEKPHLRSSDETFFYMKIKAVVSRNPDAVEESVFNLDDPASQMRSKMSEACKYKIPEMELKEVYSDREKIRRAVMEEMVDNFGEHGWLIHDVIVEDPELPESVIEASNKVMENRRRMEAAEYHRKAVYTEQVGEAEADAKSLTLRNEAAGKARVKFTEEIVKGVRHWQEKMPDVPVSFLLACMEGVDKRDAIVTASGKEGNLVLVSTGNEYAGNLNDLGHIAGLTSSLGNLQKN